MSLRLHTVPQSMGKSQWKTQALCNWHLGDNAWIMHRDATATDHSWKDLSRNSTNTNPSITSERLDRTSAGHSRKNTNSAAARRTNARVSEQYKASMSAPFHSPPDQTERGKFTPPHGRTCHGGNGRWGTRGSGQQG